MPGSEPISFSEDQLCLLLARRELVPHVQGQARALLATTLCWERVLGLASAQGVFPLLYHNLQMLGFPGVPVDIRTELEASYRINALRNTLLAQELTQVLRLLDEAQVPVIPLKGVTLAESLYGDITLRTCADIDILVPRQMVPQGFHLILARGYRAEVTERFFADLLLATNIEYGLVREERGICYVLEIHWGVLGGTPFDGDSTEDLWAEARPKNYFGVPAYRLSPEWELLFLITHAARHRWQGLKWLVDIHEVCSLGKIDWEKVREKAKRFGWEEIVSLTLSACHALFDTPIPAIFSLRVLPTWLKLFPDNPSPSDTIKAALFLSRLLGGPSETLPSLFHTLLVPTIADYRLLRLPSSLGFLYYPMRPLRLGCKWGWRLLRAGFDRPTP